MAAVLEGGWFHCYKWKGRRMSMSKCGKSLKKRRSLSFQTELRPPSQIDKPVFLLNFSLWSLLSSKEPHSEKKVAVEPFDTDFSLPPPPMSPRPQLKCDCGWWTAAWMKKCWNSTFTIHNSLGDERRRRETVILRSTEKFDLRWACSRPLMLRALQNLLHMHTRAFYISISFSTNPPFVFYFFVQEHLRLFSWWKALGDHFEHFQGHFWDSGFPACHSVLHSWSGLRLLLMTHSSVCKSFRASVPASLHILA